MHIILQAPGKTVRDGHLLKTDSSSGGSLPSRRPTRCILKQALTAAGVGEGPGGQHSRHFCHVVPVCGKTIFSPSPSSLGHLFEKSPEPVYLYDDPLQESMMWSQEH